PSAVGQTQDRGRHGGEGERPVAERMVEMSNAGGLGHDLEHVVVAEGVERIAAIVGGDRQVDASTLELVQQRDAAPARRASGAAALQVHVANRPRYLAEYH